MQEENLVKVVFAVVDDGKRLIKLPMGAQYCFKVDKKDKFVVPFKNRDTNLESQHYSQGIHTVSVSMHNAFDKAAITPTTFQSGTIKFEVKEGYVTKITAYRPEMGKTTLITGIPAKLNVDVAMIPEEIYNS